MRKNMLEKEHFFFCQLIWKFCTLRLAKTGKFYSKNSNWKNSTWQGIKTVMRINNISLDGLKTKVWCRFPVVFFSTAEFDKAYTSLARKNNRFECCLEVQRDWVSQYLPSQPWQIERYFNLQARNVLVALSSQSSPVSNFSVSLVLDVGLLQWQSPMPRNLNLWRLNYLLLAYSPWSRRCPRHLKCTSGNDSDDTLVTVLSILVRLTRFF